MNLSQKIWVTIVLALAALALPATASADITAFFGIGHGPESRAARGVSFGMSLIVVGFEVEYADISEKTDLGAAAPRLRTGMINAVAQTPTRSVQLYAVAGIGGYRENLAALRETHAAINVGGGIKLGLAGPLRLRIDYRLFTLSGEPTTRTVHRVYAGLNAGF